MALPSQCMEGDEILILGSFKVAFLQPKGEVRANWQWFKTLEQLVVGLAGRNAGKLLHRLCKGAYWKAPQLSLHNIVLCYGQSLLYSLLRGVFQQ